MNKELFAKNDFVLVKGFIDADMISNVSRYFENSLAMDRLSNRQCPDNISEYFFYADSFVEVILENSRSSMEEIVNKSLYPTYSYSRIYMGNDDLDIHVDRPSCEYSATINIARKGNPWPIWVKAPNGKPVECVLEPGDGVVYKGMEVEHWRNTLAQSGTELNVQIMLHYVDVDGPHAELKFDMREKLGLPSVH